ncbi:hypothetical protein DUI87_03122 [Hirundo rustica rustica]|uniref:ribonuclease H n=1 Tax=Hirundo rustica rustica TaxID=333673 RepID=A0A3M0L6H4_HIRRU|nr:hypothetical protein DUI87_03122 [Hirundo rustica rustica]
MGGDLRVSDGPVEMAAPTLPLPEPGRADNRLRGNCGFGSTGLLQVHWTAVLIKDRPEKMCTLSIPGATPSEICLCGLLDTSADIRIVSLAAWPPGVAIGFSADICCGVGRNGAMLCEPEACDDHELRGTDSHGFASCHSQNSCQSLGEGCSGRVGSEHWDGLLMRVTAMKGAECPTPPIRWLVDKLVWANQWPLPQDKLVGLHDLVQEHLGLGHLESSTSPWNPPVFCIKKKSGKWRLLQDLQKVNAMMESMGTLQAGMPSPTMLPADWPVLIVDLKDCFFTIPLYPNDRLKFAFSVPAINNAEPAQRYQWGVLPQGCRNSPAICQWYVARTSSGVRKQFPDAHFYHYMDDILVSASTQDQLLRVQPQLIDALHSHGLQVAPEKILGYAGYLRSVFVLTCNRKGKIQPIGKLETVTKMKVIKWMNHRVMTQMQMTFSRMRAEMSRRADETPDPKVKNPEWYRKWERMGQTLKEFSDLPAWKFSHEQIQNPDEVGKYLEENCHDDSKKKKLIAISWALAYAYRMLLDTVGQQIEAGDGDKSATTSVTHSAANTPVTQVVAKPDSEPKPVAKPDSEPKPLSVAAGKKHTNKTDRPVDDGLGEGPSKQAPDTKSKVKTPDTKSEVKGSNTKSEITTESFSLKDLCGLRKEYTR